MVLDQDLLSLLLITGKKTQTTGRGEMFPLQGNSPVTPDHCLLTRVCLSPAAQERGAGAGQGLSGSGQGSTQLGFSAAVPAAHTCVARWQPNLFLGQAAVI